MSNTNINKNFFLLSFLPAIAYWYLEENHPVHIAVIGGLILAVIEIILERIFTRHVHTLSKLNFGLILVLGSLSVFAHEGVWFKLQPFFTGIALFSFLVYKLKTGEGLLEEMSELMGTKKLPNFILRSMEWHMAFFLLIYGFFMGGLAIYADTGAWTFFKTIGFYLVFFIFMIGEMFLIRRKLSKLVKEHELLKHHFQNRS